MSASPILQVSDLSVEFRTTKGWIRVVDQVSFELSEGEVLGLVGESGSGKTVTALAILGLVRPPIGRVSTGHVTLRGQEIIGLPLNELNKIRGKDIGIIFQEPVRSLNPAFTVGDQITETLLSHTDVSRREASDKAIEMLRLVNIDNPERVIGRYAHQLSGGMCQRVMIAMALICEPRVLVADEPTTALDVTVQAQVLDLLKDLQKRLRLAILFITHDLSVVADMCDRVQVMYAGQIIESAPVTDLFQRPQHPYTEGLLASIPNILSKSARFDAIPGRVPPPTAWPKGCRFHTRCRYSKEDICTEHVLPLRSLMDNRLSRCARVDDLTLRGTSLG